jgi:hypothetical protein
MVGFVDNSTGTYNDFRPQHELEYRIMTKRMQSDAQKWNDLAGNSSFRNVLSTSLDSNSNPMEPRNRYLTLQTNPSPLKTQRQVK